MNAILMLGPILLLVEIEATVSNIKYSKNLTDKQGSNRLGSQWGLDKHVLNRESFSLRQKKNIKAWKSTSYGVYV